MKKSRHLLMCIIFMHNNAQAEQCIPETIRSLIQTNIDSPLSYKALQKRENELNNINTLQKIELANLNKNKETIINQYETDKNKIEKDFEKKRKNLDLIANNLEESYSSIKKKFIEEKNAKLEKLAQEHEKSLKDIITKIENIIEKHYQANIEYDKKRAQLEHDFEKGTIHALKEQIKHLRKIKSDHDHDFLENKPNIPKNEYIKAGFTWYDWWYNNLFQLTADADETTCSNCLDTENNINAGLLDNLNISQETKEALQFIARKLTHIQNGFAIETDATNGVQAIKVGTDIRFRKKDSRPLVHESISQDTAN